MTSTITIRLDSKLKNELTKKLKSMGLSINEYFNLAARQLVLQNKLPFDLLSSSAGPSSATKNALVTAQAKELGIISDDSPSFNDMDDLKCYLNDK